MPKYLFTRWLPLIIYCLIIFIQSVFISHQFRNVFFQLIGNLCHFLIDGDANRGLVNKIDKLQNTTLRVEYHC